MASAFTDSHLLSMTDPHQLTTPVLMRFFNSSVYQEKERTRETDRQTDRQTESETEAERDRETERKKQRENNNKCISNAPNRSMTTHV